MFALIAERPAAARSKIKGFRPLTRPSSFLLVDPKRNGTKEKRLPDTSTARGVTCNGIFRLGILPRSENAAHPWAAPFGSTDSAVRVTAIKSIAPSDVTAIKSPQTASDNDVNVKSRSRIGGSIITIDDSSPPTRTGRPSSSMLLSMITGDSLKRKFFTGCLISPFSM